MKRKIIAVVIIALTLVLTGCANNLENISDSKGNIIKRTLREIYSEEEYGFYVKNLDGTFSPVMSDTPGRSTAQNFSFDEKKKFFWWCDARIKNKNIIHEDLIPVVTKDTPLVIIQGSDSEMPTSYYIEEYEDLGYTVGVKFHIAPNGKYLYFTSNDVCPYSSFDAVNEAFPDKETRVIEINESDKLPLKNIEYSTGVMLGLEAQKYYKFTCFVGTSTREYTVKADTRIFRSKNSKTLDIPYTETKSHYFIINLPENIAPGYYYINNSGLFKVVDPDEAVASEEDNVPITQAVEEKIETVKSGNLPYKAILPAGIGLLALIIISIIATWKLFVKADEQGWKSLIPIYSSWIMFKIAYGKGTRMLLTLIPIAGIVFYILFLLDFSNAYGKRGIGFKLGLIFLSPIFLAIMGLSKKITYVGPKEA